MTDNYSRYTVLPVHGDVGVKSGGESVFNNHPDEKVLNVRPNELVFFNPDTNQTLASGDIATASNVTVAIGLDNDNDGVADELRFIAGEYVDLCSSVHDADVQSPVCGNTQVLDIFFDCTECQETYTFGVELDDNFVRTQYEFNQEAIYTYPISTECGSCDDCSPEHNCKEVACKLRDKINGNFKGDIDMIPNIPFNDITKNYQPFKAARLFSNSYKYTLTLQDGTCEDCTYLDAIAEATIDGSPYTFTNAQNPSDGTQTLPGQLQNIESQLNRELGDYGSAYLKQKSGTCCDFVLEVNTCYSDFELRDDEDVAITPDDEGPTDPFQSFTVEEDCPDCGEGDGSVTFNCGVRLFVDPVDVKDGCNCDWPPNRPIPSYFGRTIDVDFYGENDVDQIDRHVHEVSTQTLPTGFGLFWQDKERFQSLGGSSLDFRYTNRNKGIVGLPDKHSRAQHILSECHQQYCVYSFTGIRNYRESNVAGRYAGNKFLTYVIIPSGDSTTRSEFETYINAILDRADCPVQGTLSC